MKKFVALLLAMMLVAAIGLAAAEVKVGDYVTFGSYEQDNHADNGQEPIEWRVLNILDGDALLLSKYVLDAKPYHNKYTYLTWETSTLRKWLNGTFLKKAFTADEQAMLVETTVDNSNGQGRHSGIYSGKNTKDKVFLLSYHQVYGKYLKTQKQRRAEATAYAKSRGATVYTKGSKYTEWWLRTPGTSQTAFSFVTWMGSDLKKIEDPVTGKITYERIELESRPNNKNIGVRPAVWVKLEAIQK